MQWKYSLWNNCLGHHGIIHSYLYTCPSVPDRSIFIDMERKKEKSQSAREDDGKTNLGNNVESNWDNRTEEPRVIFIMHYKCLIFIFLLAWYWGQRARWPCVSLFSRQRWMCSDRCIKQLQWVGGIRTKAWGESSSCLKGPISNRDRKEKINWKIWGQQKNGKENAIIKARIMKFMMFFLTFCPN